MVLFIVVAIASAFVILVPLRRWRAQRYFYELAQRENVPIEFYGKVVEQGGTPITGATVDLRVSGWEANPLPDKELHTSLVFQKVTDENGLFSVTGYRGLFLEVKAVSNEGYQLDPKSRFSFLYSTSFDARERHYPDPANPVLFYMWKKAATEPLIERDLGFRLHVDNSPITIDLLTGKSQPGRVSTGDLQVSLKRQEGLLYPKPPYDWEFEIKAINGGIVETNDVFLYQAPDSGYQSGYKYPLRSANVPGGADAKKKYYVRGRDGSFFASLDVEVNSNSDNRDEPWGGIRIHCLLNPRGSRNLEPDKSKKLNP